MAELFTLKPSRCTDYLFCIFTQGFIHGHISSVYHPGLISKFNFGIEVNAQLDMLFLENYH